MVDDFDPRFFIDRQFEQELFEILLGLTDETRILGIQDQSGMGKSALLKMFRYRCRTVKPRIPVSLVDLARLQDLTPLTLIQQVVEHLSAFGVAFPRFRQQEAARLSTDFATLSAAVYLEGADLRSAQDVRIAGTHIEQAKEVVINSGEWGPEHEKFARDACVQSFLADLSAFCSEELAVIMLDTYERLQDRDNRSARDLANWLVEVFLDQLFFDFEQRPAKLVLVISGQQILPFHHHWALDDCERNVCSVNALHKWEREHIEECLRIYGYSYTESELDVFCKWMKEGKMTPFEILGVMQTISK
jgi:hypothetical protein